MSKFNKNPLRFKKFGNGLVQVYTYLINTECMYKGTNLMWASVF